MNEQDDVADIIFDDDGKVCRALFYGCFARELADGSLVVCDCETNGERVYATIPATSWTQRSVD